MATLGRCLILSKWTGRLRTSKSHSTQNEKVSSHAFCVAIGNWLGASASRNKTPCEHFVLHLFGNYIVKGAQHPHSLLIIERDACTSDLCVYFCLVYVRMHVLYCNLNNCSIPMEERRSKNVCQRRRRVTPTTVFRGRTVFVVDGVVRRTTARGCHIRGLQCQLGSHTTATPHGRANVVHAAVAIGGLSTPIASTESFGRNLILASYNVSEFGENEHGVSAQHAANCQVDNFGKFDNCAAQERRGR